MVSIVERASIHAPIERCFYLSLNIDLHQESTARTQERAVAGVTTGFIGLGEQVTWRGRHFWNHAAPHERKIGRAHV